MKRRWLSLLLALCMILSLFPVSAFAVSEEGASYEAGGFEEGEDVADDNFDDGDEGEGMTYFDAYAEQSDFWVAPGETPTLTVEIDTDGDLSQVAYQWGQYAEEVDEESGEVESRFVPFDGATAESYTVDPVASGQYICVVTAPDGGSREISFHVYVENNLSVEWADNVINRVEPGDSAYLAVEVDGIDLSLVTYQWYVDQGDRMDAIEGATESSFTTGPITDTTFYRCAVDDGFGGSDYSDFRVYIENHFRAEALGPENVGVALGSTAELAVEVSGNDLSGVTYQWYHLEDVTYTEDPEEEDDEPYTYTEREWVKIDGETGDTFTTGAITELQEFRCEVQDRYQNLESVDFNVNVDNHFELEPVGDPDRYAQPGETLELQVAASADDLDGVTYQWYVLDDEGEWNLLDVTGDVCTTEPVDGYIRYVCTAKDAFDSTRDVWFYIHVDNDFNAWAEDGEEILTPAGDRAMLSVAVSGNNLDRVTYQWYHLETLEAEEDGEVYTYKNYVLLPDETESQLETAAITERNQYSCTVKDGFGNEAEVQFVVLPDNHFTVERVGDEDLYLNPNQSADLAVNVQADDTTGMKLEWWGNEEVEHDSYTSTDWVLLAEGTDNFITPNLTKSQDYLFRATDRYGTIQEIRFCVYVDNHFSLRPVGDTEIKVLANEWTDLQVEASGEDLSNVTYQWYHVVTNEYENEDGELYTQPHYYAMDGETGSSCSVMASAGREQYVCRAWDAYGSKDEVEFWVTLENHFDAHAANHRNDFSISEGATVDMQVEVECDDPSNLTYTWYRESRSLTTNDDGAWSFDYNTEELAETGSTLTSDPIDYYTSYYCHVQDGYGNSENVWFNTYVDNHFSVDASSDQWVYVPYGETTDLQLRVSGTNTEGVLYNWYCLTRELHTDDEGETWWGYNWQILPDKTDSITTAPITDYTRYECEAVDGYGNTYSVTFYVYVENEFSARPADGIGSISVQPGEPALLQVEVSGLQLDGVIYEWYRQTQHRYYEADGTYSIGWEEEKLEDVTGDSYTIDAVNGYEQYYCRVTDKFGSSVNVWFSVRVDNPFTVKAPDDVYEYQVAPGDSVDLQVTVSGDQVYDASYQWYREDYDTWTDESGNTYSDCTTRLIYGATQSSYTTPAINRYTLFYCTVTDRYGNENSCPSFVISIDNGFRAEAVGDTDLYVPAGDTAQLQVSASVNDGSDLTYRWYREILELSHGSQGFGVRYVNRELIATGVDGITTEPVNGYEQYCCQVEDEYGHSETIWFTLYVDNQLEVSRVGNSERRVTIGESETLQVEASANDTSELTYLWFRLEPYQQTDEDGNEYETTRWVSVGDNSDTLVTAPISGSEGYRCYVYDQYDNHQSVWFNLYPENHFHAYAMNEINSIHVTPGATADLQVAVEADNMDGVTYQWYHLTEVEYNEDGSTWTENEWRPVEGANNSAFTTDPVQAYVEYYCHVEDVYGNYANVWFYLYPENHLEVSRIGSSHRYLAPGETDTLQVEASADDMSGLTYQWYRYDEVEYIDEDGEPYTEWNWMPIEGETENVLTTDPLTGFTQYYCSVRDQYDNAEECYFYLYVVNHFSAQALDERNNISVPPGETAQMEVVATADITDRLSYRWYHLEEVEYSDGDETWTDNEWVPVEGADQNTLTTGAIQSREQYYCTVEDGYGNSEEVYFYINVDNQFRVSYVGSSDRGVAPGQTETLQVRASATDMSGLTYQWYHLEQVWVEEDGESYEEDRWVPVGDNSDTYVTDPITKYEEYYCNVRDQYDNSRTCWYYLWADNEFNAFPIDENGTFYVSAGESVDMQVQVDAKLTDKITFQWQHYEADEWVNVEGANQNALTSCAVQSMERYRCHVEDGYGGVADVPFRLYVENHFNAYPLDGNCDVYAAPGEPARLQVIVEADNTDQVTYQWRHYELVEYEDGEERWSNYEYVLVEGANESVLTTDAIQSPQEYSCYVNDGFGNQTTIYFTVRVDNGFTAARVGDYIRGAAPGEALTLEVDAHADQGPLTYQWYYQGPVQQTGEDGETWTKWMTQKLEDETGPSITAAPMLSTSAYYYCQVADPFGNATDVWFYLELDNQFEAGPANGSSTVLVQLGEAPVLEVAASAAQMDKMTYQWNIWEEVEYTDEDSGETWTEWKLVPIEGETGPTFRTPEISYYTEYACRVDDGYGSFRNVWFAVGVDSGFQAERVGDDPTCVNVGDTALLQVNASVTDGSVLTYQWRALGVTTTTQEDGTVFTDSDWYSFDEVTGDTLRLLIGGEIFYQYATCDVSDPYGNRASIWFNISADNQLAAERVGENPYYVPYGEPVTLTANVTATDMSGMGYSWYIEKPVTYSYPDATWTQMEYTPIEGANTNTLAIESVTSQTVYEMRVFDRYGNGQSVFFEVTPAHIIQQPADVSGGAGDTVTTSVAVEGMEDSLHYQWQMFDGEFWADIEGQNEPTCTLTLIPEMAMHDLRCVITNEDAELCLYSDPAAISVDLGSVYISQQPADCYVSIGNDAVFHVDAEGEDLTYQWQYQKADGSWANTTRDGNKTDTLTIPATLARNGYRYRCLVMSGDLSVPSEAAALSVFGIKTQPAPVSAKAGQTVTMSLVAVGKDLTYQWQYQKADGSWANTTRDGNKTDTLTIPATLARDGNLYRCVVTSGDLKETSECAKLTVLGIKTQPASVSTVAGEKVTMSVAAAGENLTYQWQYQKTDGTWANTTLSGCTTDTLTIPATLGRSGNLYRCVVSSGDLSVNSNGAKLTVFGIKTQPADVCAGLGSTVTMKVAATGEDMTYQWQYLKGDGTWANTTLTGCRTDTLSIKATAARNGNQYRCVVTSGDLTVASNAATLTVFTITAQPEDYTGTVSGSATFKVVATGDHLTYQWQYKTPTGSWKNSTASGNKTATVTVPITAGRDGYQYRCEVKSGDQTLNSEAATLTVLSIKTQPADVSAGLGATATMKVVATGENLTYQWQYKSTTGSWKNTTLGGCKTDTLSIPATSGRNGNQYRCVVSIGDISVTSDAAKLTVIPIKITAQPKDSEGASGDVATFTVKATGDGLSYQWQYSDNDGSTWSNSSCKTAVAAISITAKRDGRLYRCVITDADGNKLTSDSAKIIWIPVKITTQPVDYKGDNGDTATFAVAAQGDTLHYQWQFSDNNGKTWSNSTSKRFSVGCNFTEKRDGRLYRCIVTDGTGYSVTSDSAKMILTHSNIKITQQPKDYTGGIGTMATFHVTASGNGLKYQWKFTDDGVNWKSSSSKSASVTWKITEATNGRMYRCIITDASGSTRTTSIAKIIVK